MPLQTQRMGQPGPGRMGEDVSNPRLRTGGKAQQLVLVNEADGTVIGELADYSNFESSNNDLVQHDSPGPVEISINESSGKIKVRAVPEQSEQYLDLASHPAYQESGMVRASAAGSRFIVSMSDYACELIAAGADSFVKKTTPSPTPLTFRPATHTCVRHISSLSAVAANVSSRAMATASRLSQNLGASIAGNTGPSLRVPPEGGPDRSKSSSSISGGSRRSMKESKKNNTKEEEPDEKDEVQAAETGLIKQEDGKRTQAPTTTASRESADSPSYQKPGLINRSFTAASTLAGGIIESGHRVLQASMESATTVVTHRYGPEAGQLADKLGSGLIRNVILIYIDVTGVSHRAVLKGVAKGMIIGRFRAGEPEVRPKEHGAAVHNPGHAATNSDNSSGRLGRKLVA